MVNYSLVEEKLNENARQILLFIKNDYYSYMSPKKRQELNDLISSEQIVVVNKGISHFKDNTLAHGGRALNDKKIHFYPDVRKFNTGEAIATCRKLLPHECFHYFIQPDAQVDFKEKIEKEMASFYVEGLVEKEARKFYERHRDEIDFEKANYGYNINFVNAIQNRLSATSYEIIFSENDYIKNIGKYLLEYRTILKNRKDNLDTISEISKSFPIDLRNKASRKMKTMLLQYGNAEEIKEKLNTFDFISKKSVEKLDSNEEIEL